MSNPGKYLVAAPGQASRPMTLSEVNIGLASGEVMPDDQFWIKGMLRWEKVKEIPGVMLPATTKLRVSSGTNGRDPSGMVVTTAGVGNGNQTNGTASTLSFWSQPVQRTRCALWSPAAFLGLSLFFTPLLGSVLIMQNHRAANETVWRSVAWFWIVVWTVVLAAVTGFCLAPVEYDALLYWGIGYGSLAIMWLFTCALPHSSFVRSRALDSTPRSGLVKPIGYGLCGWIGVVTSCLLTR